MAASEASALTQPDSLSASDLAAYLDGRLEGKDLERVEIFLAEHPEARAELVAAARILATAPESRAPSTRRWVNWSFIAAAAAAIALVVLPLRDRPPQPTRVSTERRANVADGALLKTVSPEDGAMVQHAGVSFKWAGIPGNSYQLTVTDAEGRVMWKTTTSDTTAGLPASIGLSGPATYFWNVDALAADGSSITTGVHEFKVEAK